MCILIEPDQGIVTQFNVNNAGWTAVQPVVDAWARGEVEVETRASGSRRVIVIGGGFGGFAR